VPDDASYRAQTTTVAAGTGFPAAASVTLPVSLAQLLVG
jgi:hypothetical protein